LRKPKTFDTFYVNWLSGTSPWWAYPYIVAKTINVKMGRYIHNFDEITCRIIMMDFPGRDLIHNIIMKNGLDRSVCKSQQIFFDRKDIIHIPWLIFISNHLRKQMRRNFRQMYYIYQIQWVKYLKFNLTSITDLLRNVINAKISFLYEFA
jgi:hypothetical protein